MTVPSDDRRAGMFVGLAKRWRDGRAARKSIDELSRCGREAANIAHDLGLSTAELYALTAKPPDSADRLKRRVEALHLDRDALIRIDPRVARDLERTCTLCEKKSRCEHDLTKSPDDPVWQGYCANAHTLQTLARDARMHQE